MNKLQQAAQEHRKGYYAPYRPEEIESAFLAGAAYAAGEFAEWVSENSWYYVPSYKSWKQALGRANWKTTAELYELWQQSLI